MGRIRVEANFSQESIEKNHNRYKELLNAALPFKIPDFKVRESGYLEKVADDPGFAKVDVFFYLVSKDRYKEIYEVVKTKLSPEDTLIMISRGNLVFGGEIVGNTYTVRLD